MIADQRQVLKEKLVDRLLNCIPTSLYMIFKNTQFVCQTCVVVVITYLCTKFFHLLNGMRALKDHNRYMFVTSNM